MAYLDERPVQERVVHWHPSMPPARRPLTSSRNFHSSRPAPPPRNAFPELDCIRNRISDGLLAAIERRAIEVGVSADRVLIAAGILDEDSYMMALAGWLGLEFETFDG